MKLTLDKSQIYSQNDRFRDWNSDLSVLQVNQS